MVLSLDRFYKTIEEAETAIKQYSKEHYFIRLNRLRRIKKIVFVGNRLPTNNKNFIRRESPPTNKKNVFVANRPPMNNRVLFVGNRAR